MHTGRGVVYLQAACQRLSPPEQAWRNWRKRMVRAQKRIKLGFLSRGEVGLPIHIKTLYVELPQKTTLLLPPGSTGFYPDGNSPG